MAAEYALLPVIKNSAALQAYIGTNPVRCFLFRAPQRIQMPFIILSGISVEPNETKTGPSGLDIERVQLLIYLHTIDAGAYALEEAVRNELDGLTGTFNGINVDGCTLEDRDSFIEQLVDKDVFVFEHIYKTLIIRP